MFNVKTLNNISDVIYNQLKGQKYIVTDEADNCDAILVRSADMQTAELPEGLLAIARAGAGYNNIPVDRCTEKGIVVFNTPGANANAVKEMVICGLLLSGRKVIEGISWLNEEAESCSEDLEGKVEKGKKQFIGPELYGKTLGVIGLGAIGVMVANSADKGLGMNVLGYDPYLSVQAAWNLSRSIKHVNTLEEIFAQSDYITLHIPQNEKTQGMIGETAIASMKEGAVLLNLARGGLINEDAVLNALQSGHLRRYVTDIPSAKLVGKKGVIATPHLGASTPQAEENCAEMAAKQLKSYLEDGNIINSVNLPRCEMPRNGGFRISVIHRNIKNMVGQITALLADAGNNIEHMVNSSRGDWAYSMLDLESRPDEKCLEAIKGIEGVVRVRLI